jgi:hypothetical protein
MVVCVEMLFASNCLFGEMVKIGSCELELVQALDDAKIPVIEKD